MMRKIARHIQHYFPLFGILIFGALGFILFTYDKNFQATIAIAMSLSYITWGLVHHYLHGDLHINIIIEYISIAILGFVVMLSLIFRA